MTEYINEMLEKEEIAVSEMNVKAKSRKTRKSNRYEKEKRKKAEMSMNATLGPKLAKASKRAWHKAQRRAEEPAKSYKGNYSFHDAIWEII